MGANIVGIANPASGNTNEMRQRHQRTKIQGIKEWHQQRLDNCLFDALPICRIDSYYCIISPLLMPFLYPLDFSSLVSLTHSIRISRSWICDAHDISTHDIFHLILSHLFYLSDCCCYCCCGSYLGCFILPCSYLFTHGIDVWSLCNCIIYLWTWPFVSLVLPMWSLCLNLLCRFLHRSLHLSCTSCINCTFILLETKFIDQIIFTCAKLWSQAFTSLLHQWKISNRSLSLIWCKQ